MKELFRLKNYLVLIICLSLLLQITGCCKKRDNPTNTYSKRNNTEQRSRDNKRDISVPTESSKLIDKTGLNYSIDKNTNSSSFATPKTLSHFERRYLNGVKELENGEYDKALRVFEDILREYPHGEEASIATLCMAEVYFRIKNNEAALKLYKEIVEKYPGTQAAQNAAEGVKYLESFNKLEKEFVSPEVEDRKRRGR